MTLLERLLSKLDGEHAVHQAHAYTVDSAAHAAEDASKARTYDRKALLMAAEIARTCGPSCSVLEIGCGSGFFTEKLAARLPGVCFLATDAHEGVLAAARERLRGSPNVAVASFDGTGQPPGAPFDAVVGVDVIHHIADPIAALRGWRDLVKPLGRLLFMESNPANPVLFLRAIGRPEERRLFLNSPGRLRRWVDEAGWTAQATENLPFYLPAGPPSLSGALGRAEDALHRGRVLWGRFSGLILVRGTAPARP